MFDKIKNWLFNRAFRLSHGTTVQLAKKLHVSADTISTYNDAAAGVAGDQVVNVLNRWQSGEGK